MKPSARVALIVALAATTAPTWASLPFYSPEYTYDSTTGAGYRHADSGFLRSGGIAPDGKAAGTMLYHESHVALNYIIATWRGQTPLPTPQEDNDHISPRMSDINRYGWICGVTEDPSPAVWRPDGARIDLPQLPWPFPDEPNPGEAVDMSDTGLVVGWTTKYEIDTHHRPVYWTPSSDLVELDNPLTPNENWWGEAKSISSNGIIAGYVVDLVWGDQHAMRWDINGTAPILSQTTDTGITFGLTEASRSLDDGTILGSGRIGSTDVGILWTPDGEAIELRKLQNATSQVTIAYEINNSHYSAGAGRNSLGQLVGIRWSPTGEPFALDQLADAPSNTYYIAYDINDLNFVIGRSQAGTDQRVILWTPNGDAIDMNSLVETDDEWKLFTADSITNTGWISGVGNFDPVGPATAYKRPFSILVPFAGTYGMGDANFDESIDFADLLIVAQNYGTQTNGSFDVGDFNLDGSVNFTDLLAIAQNYGNVLGDATGDIFTMLPNSPNPTFESDWQAARGMVPEPGAVGLICIGLMLLTSRKRQRRSFSEFESNFADQEFDRR